MMETRNLSIRESIFEDCEYFAKWESDPVITEYLSCEEERSYKDVVGEWVLDSQDKTKLQMTVVDKKLRQPIGRIYITDIDPAKDSLDITRFYYIADAEKRMEVGREILVEVLEHFFIFLHMERVTVELYTGDKEGEDLFESLGFVREGIERNATKKNGRYFDMHLMSLLRSDFFEKVHDRQLELIRQSELIKIRKIQYAAVLLMQYHKHKYDITVKIIM